MNEALGIVKTEVAGVRPPAPGTALATTQATGGPGAFYRADELGIVTELQARRSAVVQRLSPTARHQAFPKVYAKPVPIDRVPNEERQELHRLRLENTNLRAKVSGLEARVEILLLTQDKAAVLANRRITVLDAFPRASADRIINIVAKHWEVDERTLRAAIRVRKFVRPRQAAYWLLLNLLNLSSSNIGRCFNRDHTTVLHGIATARRLFVNDVEWRTRYDAALSELTADTQ